MTSTNNQPQEIAPVNEVLDESLDEENSSRNRLLLKVASGTGALVLVATGFLAGRSMGSETDSTTENDIIPPTTEAPVVPGEDTAPTTEVTTTSSPENSSLSLADMLTAFVDERGGPNQEIKMTTDDPEEALSIYHHNFACAINNRDPACAEAITATDNPVGVLEAIDYHESLGSTFRFILNEIRSIEEDGKDGYVIVAVVTSESMHWTSDGGDGGTGQNRHIREYKFTWSFDRGLTASEVNVLEQIREF